MGLRKQRCCRGLTEHARALGPIARITKVIQFFCHRCSTRITGTNVVHNCERGNCVTRACRRDSKTRLYEPKCTFIPDKIQTAGASIMFMQNLNSVSAFYFFPQWPSKRVKWTGKYLHTNRLVRRQILFRMHVTTNSALKRKKVIPYKLLQYQVLIDLCFRWLNFAQKKTTMQKPQTYKTKCAIAEARGM